MNNFELGFKDTFEKLAGLGPAPEPVSLLGFLRTVDKAQKVSKATAPGRVRLRRRHVPGHDDSMPVGEYVQMQQQPYNVGKKLVKADPGFKPKNDEVASDVYKILGSDPTVREKIAPSLDRRTFSSMFRITPEEAAEVVTTATNNNPALSTELQDNVKPNTL